jgi:hypothetical protein
MTYTPSRCAEGLKACASHAKVSGGMMRVDLPTRRPPAAVTAAAGVTAAAVTAAVAVAKKRQPQQTRRAQCIAIPTCSTVDPLASSPCPRHASPSKEHITYPIAPVLPPPSPPAHCSTTFTATHCPALLLTLNPSPPQAHTHTHPGGGMWTTAHSPWPSTSSKPTPPC